MFGYNYHFTINEEKNTIKLAPTKGTYAKALMPTVVTYGALLIFGAILKSKEKRENARIYDETPND